LGGKEWHGLGLLSGYWDKKIIYYNNNNI
jgi:hypothetical protein